MKWSELTVHQEVQDETTPGWIRLLELIDDAAKDGREEFSPLREMTPEQWIEVVTLPTSIAKLKNVKKLTLYGSSLVRIPPEFGEMANLEEFSPYTSYRLHWFPYEIRRCKKSSNVVLLVLTRYMGTINFDHHLRHCHSNRVCIALILAANVMANLLICQYNVGLHVEWDGISFPC